MRTWIFQGNPDQYDIDGYLASRPAGLVWLVTRHASEIDVGDRVYLWRNQGKTGAISGVIAEALVIAQPELRDEDTEGVRFWREQGPRATDQQARVVMRLVKVAGTREVLRRDWCIEDPVLRDLPNLRMQAGTNYPVTPEQARRLDALWSRTGRDWTRNESIAGLVAYAETYGQSVSRLPGSPVATVSLLIGRAVSGVYAKVMNFRSLDPRAAGQGMSGAGDADRAVWAEFYDPSSATLRTDVLLQEYARLWSDSPNAAEATATASNIVDEVERLEKTLTLEDLLARYRAQITRRAARPAIRLLAARAYERNPLVIAIARMRASHMCEVQGCSHPTFETVDGVQYVEVHHILPLADGGEDTIGNVACLCATHHREVHLGARRVEITAQLELTRGTKRL